MHSEVVSEIWSELKRYINTVDRAEAADTLVSTLINYDEDPDDIKKAFKGDSDIKKAMADYNNTQSGVDDDDEESDEEYDEEYDEDYD